VLAPASSQDAKRRVAVGVRVVPRAMQDNYCLVFMENIQGAS